MQFCSGVVENSQMDMSGSWSEDEPQRLPEADPPGSLRPLGSPGERPLPSDESDADLALREPYLRRVMEEFEAGRLEPYEYARRVLAINAATSAEEMSAIVERLPDGAPSAVPGEAEPVVRRQLDAVDLALLRAPHVSKTQAQTTRYVALAVVFVLFAVLIVVGIWLATHVHAATSPGTIVGGAFAVSPVWL